MTVRSTRRSLGLPLAALIIYGAAINSQVVWLYMVVAILVAALPVGMLMPLHTCRRQHTPVVRTTRRGQPPPLAEDAQRLFVGDRMVLELDDGVDLSRCELGAVRTADGAPWPYALEWRDGRALLVGDPEPHRGQIQLATIEISSSWPLGLVRALRTMPLGAASLVCPRYVVGALATAVSGVGGEQPLRRGDAEDVIGLRDYRPGDSRRQIHWMATARRGGLMIVEHAAAADSAVIISMHIDSDSSPQSSELAASLAASIAASCHHAGCAYRLLLEDGVPASRRWSDSITRLALVAPRSGLRHQPGLQIRAMRDCVSIGAAVGTTRLVPGVTLEDAVAALLEFA